MKLFKSLRQGWSFKDFKQKSGIDYFDTYAPVACISTIRLLIDMASIHNLIIHQMDVKTTFLNGDLDEEVYMNQPQGFIMPGKENKVDLTNEFLSSRFSIKDMGEADVILGIRIKHESNGIKILQSHYIENVLKKFNYFDCTPASKKETCITGSTIESKFMALAAVGKEAEWLRNLILEILLWSKPIAPIPIRCDSAATLAKAYSQMYNRKSRHLGVRHSMIHELITNRVIEFVRSQQNLANHLTKGLARDLVIKSVEGMGLKSN
ncbi:zinc finger, CCHC-type containing protein [Tanacetum coccineum]